MNRRLFVAYTPSHVPVDAVALLLAPHEGELERLDFVDGRYLPEARCAVIRGVVDSFELHVCAAHELCHALCHGLLGAVGRIPWSYEGYANLICDRVVGNPGATSVYRQHLSAFAALRQTRRELPLRRMLMIEDYEDAMPSGYLHSFASQATVFVEFLQWRARSNEDIKQVFDAAVSEESSDCQELVDRMEAAFEATVEKIEEEFVRRMADTLAE